MTAIIKTNTSTIRSISWLNAADGSVNLTPVFDGNTSAMLVNISRDSFNEIRHSKELMKETAIAVLNQ